MCGPLERPPAGWSVECLDAFRDTQFPALVALGGSIASGLAIVVLIHEQQAVVPETTVLHDGPSGKKLPGGSLRVRGLCPWRKGPPRCLREQDHRCAAGNTAVPAGGPSVPCGLRKGLRLRAIAVAERPWHSECSPGETRRRAAETSRWRHGRGGGRGARGESMAAARALRVRPWLRRGAGRERSERMKRHGNTVLILGAFLCLQTLAACDEGDDGGDAVDRSEHDLTASAASAAGYVAKMVVNGNTVCSGSFVGNRLVLTAKHCLGAPAWQFQSGAAGGVNEGAGLRAFWPADGADIAVVVTNRNTAAPFVTLRNIALAQGNCGNAVTMHGFGLQTALGPIGARRQGPGRIGWLGASTFSINPVRRVGGIPQSVVCEGDSGGPTVGNVTGHQIGVHSREQLWPGPPRCGANSVASIDVRVDPYINVVRRAAGWRNANPLPGGGGGPAPGGFAVAVDEEPAPRLDDPWLDVPPDLQDPSVEEGTDVSSQVLVDEVLVEEPGASCAPVEEFCQDGIDDDEDGLVDCSDSDCAADPVCQSVVEDCQNGIDDDGDGLPDCSDSDCAADPMCVIQES